MRFLRAIGRITAAMAVAASVVLTAPVASASPAEESAEPAGQEVGAYMAPWGERCGAYYIYLPGDGHPWLFYKHCGLNRIQVEVDRRYGDNYFICVEGWDIVSIESMYVDDNAWATGREC